MKRSELDKESLIAAIDLLAKRTAEADELDEQATTARSRQDDATLRVIALLRRVAGPRGSVLYKEQVYSINGRGSIAVNDSSLVILD